MGQWAEALSNPPPKKLAEQLKSLVVAGPWANRKGGGGRPQRPPATVPVYPDPNAMTGPIQYADGRGVWKDADQ